MNRKTIDLAAKRYGRPLEYRLVKITTASDEVSAPYKSKGSVYRSKWTTGTTERTAELTAANVRTSFFTTAGDWVFAVKTPFGYWEGIATYQADD